MQKHKSEKDDDITLPVSELNALRREACELLMKRRGEIIKKEIYPFEYPKVKNKEKVKPALVVQIRTKEQFIAASKADRVLVPISLWEEITPHERCCVLLPQAVCDDEEIAAQLSKIPNKYGVYASTLGMLMLAKKQGRKVYADWSCNIYNSVSADVFDEMCDGITLSSELSLGEIAEIVSKTSSPCEILCHGYQTVMTSRACLIRGITGKCDCTSPIRIKDKTGAEFTILGDKDTHLNTVLNSRPTFMADKMKEVYRTGVSGIRLVFTIESGEETSHTIDMYRGKTPPVKPPLFTRGYLLHR